MLLETNKPALIQKSCLWFEAMFEVQSHFRGEGWEIRDLGLGAKAKQVNGPLLALPVGSKGPTAPSSSSG